MANTTVTPPTGTTVHLERAPVWTLVREPAPTYTDDMSLRVVVADDALIAREGIVRVLEHAGGIDVVAIGDELVAHATECPHLFGPLDRCEVEGDEIVCPWHGYRFDVRTGRSRDGRSLRLRTAPRLEIDGATGHLIAHAQSPERQA